MVFLEKTALVELIPGPAHKSREDEVLYFDGTEGVASGKLVVFDDPCGVKLISTCIIKERRSAGDNFGVCLSGT